MKKTLVIAHRGFSGKYPENSRRAFLEAIAVEGCDGIETDLHLSADNEPVIIHDATLERTSNGRGAVRAASFKDLRKLDIGSWMDPQFAGEQIMHLDELLELCVQHDMLLNIEIKNAQVDYPGVEKIVIDRVVAVKAERLVFFSSFNHIAMERCRELNPKIPTGLLYAQPLIRVEEYANGHALHPHFGLFGMEPDLMERAHGAGLRVNVWTVDDEGEMRRSLELGADGVITNFPDRMVGVMERG